MGIKGGPAIEISDEEENKMDVPPAKISDGLVASEESSFTGPDKMKP